MVGVAKWPQDGSQLPPEGLLGTEDAVKLAATFQTPQSCKEKIRSHIMFYDSQLELVLLSLICWILAKCWVTIMKITFNSNSNNFNFPLCTIISNTYVILFLAFEVPTAAPDILFSAFSALLAASCKLSAREAKFPNATDGRRFFFFWTPALVDKGGRLAVSSANIIICG